MSERRKSWIIDHPLDAKNTISPTGSLESRIVPTTEKQQQTYKQLNGKNYPALQRVNGGLNKGFSTCGAMGYFQGRREAVENYLFVFLCNLFHLSVNQRTYSVLIVQLLGAIHHTLRTTSLYPRLLSLSGEWTWLEFLSKLDAGN